MYNVYDNFINKLRIYLKYVWYVLHFVWSARDQGLEPRFRHNGVGDLVSTSDIIELLKWLNTMDSIWIVGFFKVPIQAPARAFTT